MPFREVYQRQVSLLIKILPFVAEEECFALKGGTAINLFIREMPRLSVDIDLTYLPVSSRADSIVAIDDAMRRIAQRILKSLRGAQVFLSEINPEKAVTKLLIRQEGVQVKIETTPVLRGCVYASELRSVSPVVESTFGFAEIRVVSFEDLFAGKIVAALDRQHPRDLFDVRGLLDQEEIGDRLRCAFIVYLISHNRPMAEILAPTRKKLTEEFQRGFQGMTAQPVALDELISARESLIASIVGGMPQSHRQFLISFERGEPNWSLLELPVAYELPAVKWRQQNLDTLTKRDRAKLVLQLENALSSTDASAPSGA